MYKKIDSEGLEELRGILGNGNLLTPEDDLDSYAHDEVAELWHEPEAVARVTPLNRSQTCSSSLRKSDFL